MSLATRCTACGTIFRVVQDQLKVSEGWVRCGRCDHVFNAVEGLFDLERESPPKWTPPTTEKVLGELVAQRRSDPDTPAESGESLFPTTQRDEREVAQLDEEDRIASRLFHPEQDDVEQTPAQSVGVRDRADFADAQFNTELLGEVSDSDVSESAERDTPDFVRQAHRQSRWQQPKVRAQLSGLAIVLLLGLGLQMVHHSRDHLAARWPGTQPLLAGWCALAGCRIEAPRRIDDVSVESTALVRTTAAADTFRLAVTLRNRGRVVVAMPAIDLSLTDANGQLVARRALMPADFGVTQTAIRAGTEAALQLLISTGTPRVSGYTVEVFYP